ncbi:helix-turn-helix domain-containing protein [Leisingera sp. NJS204]|nr:helix-turn-helix domain-containing protein [Leisingera sp. NJS204]QAX28805.1 helix-turn-helix domain-containing protein [Leisingera sp. NJS204]
MRYPASENLESIRLVEGSHLPARRRQDKPGIPRTTFCRWYDRYLSGGPEALEDRSPRPSRVWNRIPEPVREKIKDLALHQSDLSPRELAVQFTDTEKYPRPLSLGPMALQWLDVRGFDLSTARQGIAQQCPERDILKAYELITNPAYVVLSASDEFRDKTTRPNQL